MIEKLPASLVNFWTYLQRIRGRLTSLEDILIRIKFENLNKNLKENQSCSIRDEKLEANTTHSSKKLVLLIRNLKEFVTNVENITMFNII